MNSTEPSPSRIALEGEITVDGDRSDFGYDALSKYVGKIIERTVNRGKDFRWGTYRFSFASDPATDEVKCTLDIQMNGDRFLSSIGYGKRSQTAFKDALRKVDDQIDDEASADRLDRIA